MNDVILVVEDDRRQRVTMQRALQLRGYAVLTAENASEATLVALRYGKPIRLLLADAACTGMNIGRLVQEISQTSPHLTVLLMRKEGECHPKGYDQLDKPFTMPELVQKVRSVLSNLAKPR
jgi:DNA-binding NtrC family response regulator